MKKGVFITNLRQTVFNPLGIEPHVSAIQDMVIDLRSVWYIIFLYWVSLFVQNKNIN